MAIAQTHEQLRDQIAKMVASLPESREALAMARVMECPADVISGLDDSIAGILRAAANFDQLDAEQKLLDARIEMGKLLYGE